ncbi:MAG: non-ribosomal peptide synthetase, partial [bacterium]|nr:non-ribosomal peptide synthetase [bacterium]
ITLAFLPTPLAESVLAEPRPAHLRLRALLTGGDRLHRRPGRELPFTLVNHYGPTENTVVTTWTAVAPDERGTAPPIGRPIANHRSYLLGADLGPVPIGVAGELCVAGPGLARGYRGRPRLTAEKFIPDPFADQPGRRLYRTGDLARALADGTIEFLGRIDHQVKVRGFRIELGEIEAALGRHPAVREAVVVAVRAELESAAVEDHRLVAYVVSEGEEAATAATLREFLRQTLPDYMVPSAFVALEALPLGPTGKVDRQALPAPDQLEGEEGFVPPATPLETLVARVWSEVFEMTGRTPPQVGRTDNFFAMGGHSLLATQVFARLNESLATELPLSLIFDTADLGELAARIGELVGEETNPGLTPWAKLSRPPGSGVGAAHQHSTDADGRGNWV